MRVLVLDNYDSFTWNLVQYLGELDTEPVVHRNDALTVDAALALGAGAIVVSPGPCDPARAGISVALVRAAAEQGTPVLGVCLGHQALGAAFGAQVVRAERLMHGKTSDIHHLGHGVFEGLADPLRVMRYHSLVVEAATLPGCLEITAWSADREPGHEVMGLRHRRLPAWGVQFHPESVSTETGRQLLENFLGLARAA